MTDADNRPAVAGQVERPVRPRCFEAAMDGVSQYEEREIRAYIKRLEEWAESEKAAERERCGQVYGHREVAMSGEIRRLAREAHTWSKAAETYAAELERHKPLMQAVEWILEDGHMNQEHSARLRAAWEAA